MSPDSSLPTPRKQLAQSGSGRMVMHMSVPPKSINISLTSVYVPEDPAFMALCGADIDAFSRRLTPVIAHDRSSLGGALCSLGLTLLLIFRRLPFSYALWQTVGLTGLFGFGSALGIHYYIGYTTFTHLAPAWLGLIIFLIGIVRTKPKIR